MFMLLSRVKCIFVLLLGCYVTEILGNNKPPSSTGWWNMEGKRALVTGGSKGIGYAIVDELAGTFGCSVLTCARSNSDLEAALKEFKKKGYDVHGCVADVSTSEGRKALIEKANELFDGSLDILVNNAGTNIRKATVDYEEDELEFILRTNFISCFELCKLAHPLLLKKKTGNKKCKDDDDDDQTITTSSSIINIGSVAGVTCMKSGTPYAATKAAMNQLTGNLAIEWARDGIRVNCITPWYISTPLALQVLQNEEYKAQVLDRTPAARVGKPQEVAALAAFLCLPCAGYITGQVISIDGGFTRQGFYDPFYSQ